MRHPTSAGAQGSTAVAQGFSTSSPPRSSEAPPKSNAVPHEVEVVVTGARPGRASSNRELFTETTSTVLVFENGAVIRLGAAVEPGQLLFVTYAKYKREVIAQVTRKRDSRPSSCYVELEFSEAFPGFWGVEFPKAPEPARVSSLQKEVAELVESAEVVEDGAEPQAPAPSMAEMAALKEEVEALRKKLKQVEAHSEDAAPANSSQSAALESASKPAKEEEPSSNEQTGGTGLEEAHRELSAAEEAMLPKVSLDFGSAPAPKASSKLRQELKTKSPVRARSNSPRAILPVAAALLVGIGVAYFEHWIPRPVAGKHEAKTAAAEPAKNPPLAIMAISTPTAAGMPLQANIAASGGVELPAVKNQMAQPAGASVATAVGPSSPDVLRTSPASGVVAAGAEKSSALRPAASEKPAMVNAVSKRAILRAPVESSTVTASGASDAAGIMAPKLLKAARPNSPAEALQGFISGNVLLDAIVDPTGHIKSAKVLSGPEKLRKTAMEAIRDYKYDPAMQNGKPVSAHVNVTVQFWYEP
jgi:protein TonB